MRTAEVLAILACVGLLLAVPALLRWDDAPKPPTTFAPSPANANAVARADATILQTDGPVTYFLTNCARCHGDPEGAYAEFATPRRDEALRQMIVLMADGPAMAPLEPAGVQEQFDLHNAMLDKQPYLWIDPTAPDRLAGEVFPGSTVALLMPDGRIEATIDEHRFALPRKAGVIEVRWLGRTARVTP